MNLLNKWYLGINSTQTCFWYTVNWVVFVVGIGVFGGTHSHGLVSGNKGTYGYSTVPSAQPMPQGVVFTGISSRPSSELKHPQSANSVAQWNMVYGLTQHIELGTQVQMEVHQNESRFYTSQLSVKYAFPVLHSDLPIVAIGVRDIANPHIPFHDPYFVIQKLWKQQYYQASFDMGAIWHRSVNPYTSKQSYFGMQSVDSSYTLPFFAFSLHALQMELQLELIMAHASPVLIPALYWRPFQSRGDVNSLAPAQSQVQFGIGIDTQNRNPAQLSDAWVQVAVLHNITRQQDTIMDAGGRRFISGEPMITWKLAPEWQFIANPASVSTGSVPSSRLAQSSQSSQFRLQLRNDIIARFLVPGLYWVNGIDVPLAHSTQEHALSPSKIWNRSYLSYGFSKPIPLSESFSLQAPVLAVGFFEGQYIGALWEQSLQLKGWPAFTNTAGVFMDSVESVLPYNELTAPLHPILPGFAQYTHLQLQAGYSIFQNAYVGAALQQDLFRNRTNSQGTSAFYGRVGVQFDLGRSEFLATAQLHMPLHAFWEGISLGALTIAPGTISQHSSVLLANMQNAYAPNTIRINDLRILHKANNNGQKQFGRQELPLLSCDPPQEWQFVSLLPYCDDEDYDQDGIMNSQDICPEDKEDFDGFLDADGCPDPDNDEDGVCDPWVTEQGLLYKYADICRGVDLCPNDPEDMDGFEDEDGCPDPDNDKDGICDPWVAEQGLQKQYSHICRGIDLCPNKSEDFDGFEDEDGCPDPDNDKDGVCDPWVAEQGFTALYSSVCEGTDNCPDIPVTPQVPGVAGCPEYTDNDGIPFEVDACPFEDETFNGFLDYDGCPD
jgi:hypothetical protein